MEQDYCIGQHRFETEEEYRIASRDYEYSRQFMKQLDLRKPALARQLYEKLEASPHLMRSKVGEAFKDKLVEIFVRDVVIRGKTRVEAPQKITVLQWLKQAGTGIFHRIYRDIFFTVTGLQILFCLDTFLLSRMKTTSGSKVMKVLTLCWIGYRVYAKYIITAMMAVSVILLFGTWIYGICRKKDQTAKIRFLLLSGICSVVYLITMMKMSS